MYSILTALCYYMYLSTVAANTVFQQTNEELQSYDTTNVNESQIISLLAHNGDINPNGNDSRVPQSSCRSCRDREHRKQNWISNIKKRVSHALKLDILGLPNITNGIIPMVPSYRKLTQRYLHNNLGMQADSPFQSFIDDEVEEYGKPERTFTSAKLPPEDLEVSDPNALYFDIPDFSNKEIHRAWIWVYIKPNSSINVLNNVTEMYLYAFVPPGKHGGPPVKIFLKRKKRSLDYTAKWHHFDVKSTVENWAENPSSNLGLVVEAFDAETNNIIVSPNSSLYHEGYGPVLDVRTKLIPNRRRKRSTSLDCDHRTHIEACCRYPLQVNFVEFGWDFVIAPIWYEAFYCAGDCEEEHLNAQPHGHVIQQVDNGPVNTPRAGPCCSATRLSPLNMLYFDHEQRIRLTMLPRMKVERCGCA